MISEPATLARRLRNPAPAAPLPEFSAIQHPGGWLKHLQDGMDGRVVVPGEADYDARRHLFDPRFDPRPRAIALCASEADVAACLAAARAFKVPFRLRGGGHSFAGFSACDDLVVDLAGLKSIAISPEAMQMTIGGGCAQGQAAEQLAAHGLHVTTGEWETVGIGGYMQGGGFGAFSRTFGMNSDNVVALRVMLADGRIVTATEHHNHDLWWAMRGGTGNNFGVVLEITYRLHKMPEFAEVTIAFSLAPDKREQGIAALLAYQAHCMLTAHRTFNSSALIAQTVDPAAESPWLVIEAFQIGTADQLATALDPLLALPGVTTGFDVNRLVPATPMPPFSRTSRLIARTLAAEEWRGLLALLDTGPNRESQLFLRAHGGAINSYPREHSAFIHRDAHCNMFLDVFWSNPADREPAEAFRARWRAHVEALGNGHIYQNFPEADAPDYTRNYWGDAYPALAAVKAKYDPDGLFDFPQAIRPGDPADVTWPPQIMHALQQPIVAQSHGG